MQKIKLTQGQFALVDDRDYCYLSQWKWHANYDKRVKTFYAQRNDYSTGKCKTVIMHRIILSTEKGIVVDHKDHNGLNNQRENIRNVSNESNCRNQRLRKTNTSGFCGVSFEKSSSRWVVNIKVNGKQKKIGRFLLKEDAIKARKYANEKNGYHENHGVFK